MPFQMNTACIPHRLLPAMDSRFLCFPPEIYNTTYKETCRAKNESSIITPDPLRSRRKTGQGQRTLSLRGRPPLLQMCRQICEKGTGLLYGSHTYLDHEPYGKEEVKLPGFDANSAMCDFITMYALLSQIGSKIEEQCLLLGRPPFLCSKARIHHKCPLISGGHTPQRAQNRKM